MPLETFNFYHLKLVNEHIVSWFKTFLNNIKSGYMYIFKCYILQYNVVYFLKQLLLLLRVDVSEPSSTMSCVWVPVPCKYQSVSSHPLVCNRLRSWWAPHKSPTWRSFSHEPTTKNNRQPGRTSKTDSIYWLAAVVGRQSTLRDGPIYFVHK